MENLSMSLIYQNIVDFWPFDKGPTNLVEKGAQDTISRRIKRKQILQVAYFLQPLND